MRDEAASPRKDNDDALAAHDRRQRVLVEFASDFVYSLRMEADGTTAVEWVTDAFAHLTGYTLDELYARGGWIILVHPDDLRIVLQRSRDLMHGQDVESVYRIITKNGEMRWVRDASRPEWDADHTRITRIYGAMQDITAFQQHELEARTQAESFQNLFALYPQPMWIYDLETLEFLDVNEAACRLYGYARADFLKMTLGDIRAPEDVPALRAYVSALPPVLVERMVRHRTRDGRIVLVEVTSHAIFFNGRWARHVLAHDVTARLKTEQELRHAAEHDSATGLPNRMLFMERLEACIRAARDDPAYQFAVLFVDLDHFKEINDRFGHLAGDQLLTIISRRLKQSLRPRDLVARLGGDEFTVLLDGVADEEMAAQVAARLGREVAAPISFASEIITTTASIGVILGHGGDDQPENLLRDADVAMYRAKEGGRGRHVIYRGTLNGTAAD